MAGVRVESTLIPGIVATPEVRDALSNQGAEPITGTPEEFAAIVRADVAKWARIVKATGAKPT